MADHIILVENSADWKNNFPKLPIVTAKDYLAKPEYSAAGRNLRVINLCRSYHYLSLGYYCSLLGEARRHRMIPSVHTLNDLSRKTVYSLDIDNLNHLIQPLFGKPRPGFSTTAFTLDIFFGQCAVKELQELARQLFDAFPSPLLRVEFALHGQWRITAAHPVHLYELSAEQGELFSSAMNGYLCRRWRQVRGRNNYRYDLAILHNPKEETPPSNLKALRRFVKAGRDEGVNVELIEKQDYGRLTEFDALFIRETTGIDDYTYQFAKKAEAEGMVVVNDPDSILKCTNKVYLHELLRINRIRTPKLLVTRRDNLEKVDGQIQYPIILKIPDASFVRGIFKVEERSELLAMADKLFASSDLLLAQEFVETTFDWRVAILNKIPLFACQYFTSSKYWEADYQQLNLLEQDDLGKSDILCTKDVPNIVLKAAVKAANVIGNGFYSVSLKQTVKGVIVIGVNDNPNIDDGVEDVVLKEGLYRKIIQDFVGRLERKRLR